MLVVGGCRRNRVIEVEEDDKGRKVWDAVLCSQPFKGWVAQKSAVTEPVQPACWVGVSASARGVCASVAESEGTRVRV